MNRLVIIQPKKLGEQQIEKLRQSYQDEYGVVVSIDNSDTRILPPERWAELLDSPHVNTILRYWSSQTKKLGKMLAEAYPLCGAAEAKVALLSVLADSWGDCPKGAVIFRRETNDYSIAIVFPQLAIGVDGQLRLEGAAMPLPPRYLTETDARVSLAATGGGDQVQQAIWNILKYIGAGLAEAGSPIGGAIFSVLMQLLDAFSKTADAQMTELLADIKKLLQDDRIQIETDDANAVVLTWSQYEGSHFKQSDLALLNSNNPDTSSQAYKDAHARIVAFVDKINHDLNGTPRIFDAVNLMRGDTGKNTDTYDFPTDAMLKFSYFMFYSGFVLALGKQAWLASKALNGSTSSITQGLQNEVAFLAKNYTDYVNELYISINSQVSERIARWDIEDEQPLDGHTFIIIHDTQYDSQGPLNKLSRYYPPKEWGYRGDTVFSYCGNPQRATARQQANQALVSLKQTYVDYFYGRVVKTAGDGRSMQQELDARVATFRENNAKYQNLANSSD